MPDKYDQHIEEILANPERIADDWLLGDRLFQPLRPSATIHGYCPTAIKSGYHSSYGNKLDHEVRASALIPALRAEILPDRPMLEEFARIQRLADKIYNRV